MKSLFLVFIVLTMRYAHSQQPTNNPTIAEAPVCIKFFLSDTFGDHWDTANFFAYDSYTHYQKLSPDCAHDPLFHKYCFNPLTANDGDTVSATVIGFKPDNFWEIRWRAVIASTGERFTGTYETWMKFRYNERVGSDNVVYKWVSLVQSSHLIPNTEDCTTCEKGSQVPLESLWESDDMKSNCIERREAALYEDVEEEPVSSQPSVSNNIAIVNPVAVASSSDSSDSEDNVHNYGIAIGIQNNNNKNNKNNNKNGKMLRALNDRTYYPNGATADFFYAEKRFPVMEYALYGKEQSSWDTGDTYRSAIHVSDVGGDNLYFTGSLCSGKTSIESPCDLNQLPPGNYMWRVTGAQNPDVGDIAYDFCGIHGPAMTQVTFSLDCDGECVATSVHDLSEICAEEGEVLSTSNSNSRSAARRYSSAVTLEGTIHLEGVSTELSPEDVAVVREALVNEFRTTSRNKEAVDEQSVKIVSWQQLSQDLPEASRILMRRRLEEDSPNTHELTFRVTVNSDSFGVDGSEDNAIMSLAQDLSDYLEHSMDLGVFTSSLVSKAYGADLVGLQSVTQTHLKQNMEVHTLHKTEINTRLSWIADLVVIGGGLSGLVAGFLLVRSMSKHCGLPKVSIYDMDSSHGGQQKQIPNYVLTRLSTIHDLAVAAPEKVDGVVL